MRVFAVFSLIKSNILFTYRNWVRIRRCEDFPSVEIDGISYQGFTRLYENQVARLYSVLNDDAKISWTRRKIYRSLGSRILLIAIKPSGLKKEIVGINMYYLNERDVKNGTIHEGFIGVTHHASGRGIATNMRKISKNHFYKNGFIGISTRISLSNQRSLKSALNIGFKPIDTYIDTSSNEERYYMVCDLRGDS